MVAVAQRLPQILSPHWDKKLIYVQQFDLAKTESTCEFKFKCSFSLKIRIKTHIFIFSKWTKNILLPQCEAPPIHYFFFYASNWKKVKSVGELLIIEKKLHLVRLEECSCFASGEIIVRISQISEPWNTYSHPIVLKCVLKKWPFL